MLLFSFSQINARQPSAKLYVTTLSTGFYHTGMSVPLCALFFKSTKQNAEWEYMGRPNNRIYDVDFHHQSKGQYIALATHTGVHQSFDFGKTWKVTTGWQITEVNNVSFDPQNPDIIYCSSPYGFYKSIDGGKNWDKKIVGLNSINAQFVSSFIIDFSNSDVLYCSTEDVVYKSTDKGESWNKLGLRVKSIRIIVQHPKNNQILFAGTENNGLYFSNDGGNVWQKKDTGILHNTFYAIAFDPNNPNIIFAGGFQTGVYKSTNGGNKWKQYFHGLQQLNIRAFAIDPENSSHVFAGTMGKGLYESVDGGESWKYVGIKNGYITAIKIVDFE